MDFPELRMTRVHLSNSENIEDIDSGREGHGWSKAEDALGIRKQGYIAYLVV